MSTFPIKILIVMLAVFYVGCTDATPETNIKKEMPERIMPSVADIAKNYKELSLLTPEPVYVPPILAVLCRTLTKEAVDYNRIEHGPHAHCRVKIFMNEMAAAAFEKNVPYPVGSIVVKEKRMFQFVNETNNKYEGGGIGVGGMIKRENGFDAANGNWEYFYLENDAEVEFGKIESCIQCHAKAKNFDYIFGDWANHDNRINSAAPRY